MSLLNEEQKELLFKYCLGLTLDEQTLRAEELISSNSQAAGICRRLKDALVPLDSVEPQLCPDDLVDSTVLRLSNAARTSQLRLEQLLQSEQSAKVTTKSRFWRNFAEVLAAAAVILLVLGVSFPSLRYARQKSWQVQCQTQLARVAQGLENYRADHEGQMPSVATAAGAPWWKVGYQGKENHSNTRHIWLLAKEGYVDPTDFVCPGKRQGRVIQFDAAQAKNYNDFPARRYVTYSFRIRCDKSRNYCPTGQTALVADLNPVFDELPHNYSNPFTLEVSGKLLKHNSNNHNRSGQNILFGNGSVKFTKTRRMGISNDDIFTLQNIQVYKGDEVPAVEADIFLAP